MVRNCSENRDLTCAERCTTCEVGAENKAAFRGICSSVCKCVWQPTDLFTLSVRGGIVGDFEAVEIQNVPHLVIVSPSLANDHSHVE